MEFTTWSVAIAAAITTILVLVVSRAVFNVIFHPLSTYPGPWYMAASDIPRLIYLMRGSYVALNHELHIRYGPVVRVGPRELSFTQGQAWKDIYGHNKKELAKDPLFYGKTPNGVDHIGTANREDHSRMRSMFSHAFSDRALKQQEPLILDYARKMVNQMRQKSEEAGVVNVVDMYNFATFDIIANLAFGEPLQLLDTATYTPWVRALFQGIKFMTIRGALDKIPIVSPLLRLLTDSSLKRQFESHFQYACDMVDRRLSRDINATPDIWSFVLNHSSKNLSLAEMHSNASGFMIGGGETTSTTLSGLTYLLIRHPDSMQKLNQEVRNALAKEGGDMSWSSLARLDYLNACISETLRLYPPAAVGLPRIVPPEGAQICGKNIPGGTTVYMSQYAANRSPLNFHDPDSFCPDRWLGADPRFANDSKDVYQPFSYGPRNCIGKHLAYHEVRVLICITLINFEDFQLSQSKNWMDSQKVYITWEKPPLLVKMKYVGVGS